MSGIVYLGIITGLILTGIGLVIILRIYNILAGVTVLGFKLPRI